MGRRQRLAPSAQEAAKPDTEQRQAAKPEAAKPEADGLPPQAEPGRPGHNKRLARPGEAPEKPVGKVIVAGQLHMRPGDVCDVEVDGLGVLSNPVIEDPTPAR